MGLETEILRILLELREPVLTSFFVAITAFGSLTFAAVFVAGLWHFRMKDEAVLVSTGVLVTGAIVKIMKLAIARPRPELAPQILVEASMSSSFPSGHTALAFVMATIASERFQDEKNYFYAVAFLVGFSRLYLGVHFVSDVLVGALIGWLVGRLVLKYESDILEPLPKKWLQNTN